VSLNLQPPRPLPPDIAAWGTKHLPHDSPYRLVGDELYIPLHDTDFTDLYHPEGKPALSPMLLALVSVFQAFENLSDRAAAHAVRTRLDWKYALHLPLHDDGFDASVLCEFRQRLIEHHAEARVFEAVVAHIQARGLFKRRGTQRTDSTHVLAAVRSLNRLETVGEAMRAALNSLAIVAPEWLAIHALPEWLHRYGPRFDEGRLPESHAKRQILAQQIGQDGQHLLTAVYDEHAPNWLRLLPIADVLRQIWIQQYHIDDDHIHWRSPDNLPPASLAINSPYDAEARYSSKHSTIWVGYKVHLTETCDDDLPRVITNVELTPAPAPDTTMTTTIHEHLAEADRLPTTHLADSGYIDAEHLVQSHHEYHVDLLGPVAVDPSWQARAGKGFDAAAFIVDWNAQVAICPQGKRSYYWRLIHDGNGNPTTHIEFAAADCRTCPVRTDCTRSTRRGRQLNIRRQHTHQALQAARERQKKTDFKMQYAQRAGMEGTISRGVRACGLRRSRYVGETKTRLHELFIATGLNLARISAWLAGAKPAPPRTPAFVRLMTAPTLLS
jgi:transposase